MSGEPPLLGAVLERHRGQFASAARQLGLHRVTLKKKADAINGQIVLCGIRKELMKVFSITHLNKMFKFCDDEQQSLVASIRGNGGAVVQARTGRLDLPRV